MISDAFNRVYLRFKLRFYHEVFKKWKGRDLTLTTVETFCMEIIHALDKPTVSQFAKFASLSSANAADKINNLIKKGYLRKIQSEEDRRRFYLEPTEKYKNYYDLSTSYVDSVVDKIQDRFTEDELKVMYKILTIMDEEIMT